MTAAALPGSQHQMSEATRRGVIRWWIRETLGNIILAVTVFWSAGTVKWVWGWALVALYVGWMLATAILLMPASPELLAERGTRRKDSKSWDARLMSVVGLLMLVQPIIGGLDYRFGWSAPLPVWLHLVMILIAAGGLVLFVWSMAANAYFSLIVRIQGDRAHQVVTSGPYRFVRHPGYVGSILLYVSTALVLGSLWALIPGVLAAMLMMVRTALEDRTLRAELPGYAEYAQQTRYRLLPGVW